MTHLYFLKFVFFPVVVSHCSCFSANRVPKPKTRLVDDCNDSSVVSSFVVIVHFLARSSSWGSVIFVVIITIQIIVILIARIVVEVSFNFIKVFYFTTVILKNQV